MKALFFVALIVIGAFASDSSDSDSTGKITGSTPAIMVGEWYLNGIVDVDPSDLDCCIPYGTLVFTADTVNVSQLHMTSNVWSGQLCGHYGINSTYNMTVPFPWNQTYDELEANNYYNYQGIQFQIGELDAIGNWSNGTQQVLLNFQMDYSGLGGDVCAIVMSKDLGAFYYGISGFLLILLVSFVTMF